MNIHELLKEREATGRPVRVGLIGAGRFGTMYLAQARNIPGVHVVAIADINVDRARGALNLVGWPEDQIATDIEVAIANRTTAVVGSASSLFDADIDVIVEATGNPIVGIRHCLAAIETKKHIIMVTVEADALAGPALAKRAREAGVVYSLAYGDQPAMIWEMVDWARSSGFVVVCAGKGAKYLPGYHDMNPANVWDFWDFSQELIDSGQLNPNMHTSFRDGTKAAIEMAAVANAARLQPGDGGLSFTPSELQQLATVCRPSTAGGVLELEGTVDVVSSYMPDGTPIQYNAQEGIFVVVKATNDYVKGCFGDYPWHADPSREYAALYRPYHYVGLELNISIAHAALRGVPTGAPVGFYGDVVATAKKDLVAGDILDGEGGFAVWGKLVSARTSVDQGLLPVALAHHVELVNDVPRGQPVRWDDIVIDDSLAEAIELRRETEAMVAGGVQ
jgi:predicted homoserine dehydrogenase-like protein